jgi:hypothetical protein
MDHDEDLFELLDPNSPQRDAGPTEEAATVAAPAAEVRDALIAIEIERDLCVQIVGSDAGKRRRFKPHSSMTKGVSGQEVAAVEAFMEPFLRAEAKRVHEDQSHRPRAHRGEATIDQAKALKAFCLRYAAHLKHHLERHPHDEHLHRSKHRIDQAYRLINQVNSALGLRFDDGRSLQECQRDLVAKMQTLLSELGAFRDRVDVGTAAVAETPTEKPSRALMEFQEVLKHHLGLVQQP